MLHHYLLTFAVFLTLSLSGQGYVFKHVGLDEGLSQSIVSDIIQDSIGYLWFSTEDGLNRYDGRSFKVYRYDPLDDKGLSCSDITELAYDQDGLIWATCDGVLNVFDPILEEVRNITYLFGEQAQKASFLIQDMLVSRNNNIWVATSLGLYVIEKKDTAFIVADQFLEQKDIFCLKEDQAGAIWIGSTEGLYQWSLRQQNPKKIAEVNVNHIMGVWAETNKIWITNPTGVFAFDPESGETSFLPFQIEAPNKSIGHWHAEIMGDKYDADYLWVGTKEGLVHLNKHTLNYELIQHIPAEENSLSGNFITALFYDRAGNFWVGSRSRGLNNWNPYRNLFRKFETQPDNPYSLKGNDVLSIYTDHTGNWWLGTNKGLNRYDPQSGRFTNFYPSESNTVIIDIFEDRDHRLWIGTLEGLYEFDQNTNLFTPKKQETQDGSQRRIYAITGNGDGSLFLGTPDGLIRYFPVQDRFVNYFEPPHNVDFRGIYDMEFSQNGFLWMVSDKEGLCRFHPDRPGLTKELNSQNSGLSDNSIYSLDIDTMGNIWVAVYGGGLNKYDIKKDSFSVFTVNRSGLPTNNVDALTFDHNGKLWVSTDNGLFKFDPETENLDYYDVSTGLQSREFHQSSVYLSEKGEVFFGGINGFNVFFPDEIIKNPVVPNVKITEFLVNNDVVNLSLVKNADGHSKVNNFLSLKHFQNDLTFELNAFLFDDPRFIQYSHKLLDFDSEWSLPTNNPQFNYTNIPPGKYQLLAKASNTNGLWSEPKVILQFRIARPWYATPIAYFSYSLFSLFILWYWRRFELKRIDLKNRLASEALEAERLKRIDEMKSTFFENISHEFRTPLSLIIGQIKQVIKSINNDKEKTQLHVALRNAKDMNNLVNQVLDLSKLEAGKINLNTKAGDITSFIHQIYTGFEYLSEDKGVELIFESNVGPLPMMFDPDAVHKILSNLLSNAVKFTPPGGTIKLYYDLINNEEDLQIIVEDNGIGISKEDLNNIFNRFYQARSPIEQSNPGTGIGLALTKELIQLLNGSIEVESTVGGGTIFTVILPFVHVKEPTESYIVPDPIQRFENSNSSSGINKNDEREIALIIEDNRDLRNFIKEIISPQMQVVTAKNGEEGIQLAKKLIPDLVITDLMMPIKSGIEVAQELRSEMITSHIPIIMLTAKVTDDARLDSIRTGVDHFLVKPFEQDELLLVIKNILDIRSKLKRAFNIELLQEGKIKTVESIEDFFLNQIISIIEKNIEDPDFSLNALAEQIHISPSQLHRKLKAVIDVPPGQLIRNFRLEKAAEFILQNRGTASEICYMVGFSEYSNFSRAFKQKFGVAPSKYAGNFQM